jgi:Amt family ammonium transporter
VRANRAAQSVLGKPQTELVGTTLATHVAWLEPTSRKSRPCPQLSESAPFESVAIGDVLMAVLPGGLELAVDSHLRRIDDMVLGSLVVFTLRDNSEKHDADRMARFYATHDDLTGLPRLRMLQADLRTALSQSHPSMLTLIDVHRYGSIIDYLGFDAGNALVQEAAVRIQSCLRENDHLYRLGLALFGVVSTDIGATPAHPLCTAMCEQVGSLRVQIDGQSHRLTASVGIVQLDPRLPPDVLLARASVAQTLAKRAGGNRVHMYESDDPLAQRLGTLADWTSRLHQAHDDNRLVLYVQPMLPLAPDLPTLAELLLRVTDEQGHVWAPDHFMPAAERHHLMPEIDLWVVNFVFDALNARSPALDAYQSFALNLSGQSLSDADFKNDVLSLATTNRDFAQRICFEVTESVLLVDLPEAARLLSQLKGLGYAVALDDFSAGYSSYEYLKQLPADVVKIDGTFIVDRQRDAVDRAMVDSINRLAHRLGMYTVAEHVRDAETLESLRRLGVDYAQGDAVGEPRRLIQ